MYSEKPKKKNPVLIIILLLIPFLVIIAVIGAISLNILREGAQKLIVNNNGSSEIPSEISNQLNNTEALHIPKGVKTFMLLGSDYRPQMGYRTDVILLVAVNTQKGSISLLSFPRDLWVYIPGWEMQRINTAQPYGGFELLGDTLEENFGFRPDNYAMVDFEGFKQIIDTLGGVDVKAEKAMTDRCDFTSSGWCTVEPGTMHMDGAFALWYVRARYNSSDFDRTRRAQEVIQAVLKKTISIQTLLNSSELIDILNQSLETDVRLGDMLSLVTNFGSLTEDGAIHTYAIGPNEATGWITPGGANVLLPDYPAIHQILLQVFGIESQ
ncbi:MAG: LCP family protein [Chloroflexota bacterium]